MKMNTMTKRAVRVVAYIYLEGGVVTSKFIAQKEEISQGVLMKILRLLNKANILQSHQGRGNICGGFSVARDIKEITIYDVIQAMEGGVYFGDQEEEKGGCTEAQRINNEIFRVRDSFVNELQRYSLYELLEGSKEQNSEEKILLV